MAAPKSWKGYQPNFLDGFIIPVPQFGKWKDDLAVNNETGKNELPFIYFSSFQSVSRRMPLLTASNIYRIKWVQAGREGNFESDDRIKVEEQFSTAIYKNVNKNQTEIKHKMAKGHMVRREDVQWDPKADPKMAIEAAEATFHYTNACPQHQGVNNGIWKDLESSILIKGRSKEPPKAIVFTGPILQQNDPWLLFPAEKDKVEIRCPLRFWKVVYYINEDGELRFASFLMSHKEEVEADGFVQTKLKLAEAFESTEKPFLEFDEKEKYQVNNSLIEKLTGLSFKKAKEILPEGQHSKLSQPLLESHKGVGFESFETGLVEGLIL
jgi:endonuclease G